MEKEVTKSILLFNNIREVIKAEKYCVKNGLEHTVMPVPTHLSSECGMCLRADFDNVKDIIESLKGAGIDNIEVHESRVITN